MSPLLVVVVVVGFPGEQASVLHADEYETRGGRAAGPQRRRRLLATSICERRSWPSEHSDVVVRPAERQVDGNDDGPELSTNPKYRCEHANIEMVVETRWLKCERASAHSSGRRICTVRALRRYVPPFTLRARGIRMVAVWRRSQLTCCFLDCLTLAPRAPPIPASRRTVATKLAQRVSAQARARQNLH